MFTRQKSRSNSDATRALQLGLAQAGVGAVLAMALASPVQAETAAASDNVLAVAATEASAVAAAAQVGNVDGGGDAAREPGRWLAGVSAGSLGIGPEISYRFSDHFAVRADATLFGLGINSRLDHVPYVGKVKLGSGGAQIVYYPWTNSGWHLNLGARYTRNAYDINFTLKQPLQIGNVVFTPEQIGGLSGRVASDWNVVPTFTFGHIWQPRHGVAFGFELGAMYEHNVNVGNLHAEGGALAKAAEFLSNLDIERLRINHDLDVLKFYPIAQLELGYRF